MGEARRWPRAGASWAGSRQGWLRWYIPVDGQDLVDVKGLATTCGAPFLAGQLARADAGFVARMRAEGAIVIGKTNVPMIRPGRASTNTVFGVNEEPIRPEAHGRAGSCGGAGGGAGLRGLLDFLGRWPTGGHDGLAHGIPRAWNGVCTGYRPTVGLNPARGAFPGDAGLRGSTLGAEWRARSQTWPHCCGPMVGGRVHRHRNRAQAYPRSAGSGD